MSFRLCWLKGESKFLGSVASWGALFHSVTGVSRLFGWQGVCRLARRFCRGFLTSLNLCRGFGPGGFLVACHVISLVIYHEIVGLVSSRSVRYGDRVGWLSSSGFRWPNYKGHMGDA